MLVFSLQVSALPDEQFARYIMLVTFTVLKGQIYIYAISDELEGQLNLQSGAATCSLGLEEIIYAS